MAGLSGIIAELEDNTRDTKAEQIVKAPFQYPGGKSKSSGFIKQHLPYRKTFVEVFGGSGAIILSREPCPIEVYNDRYSGVVDFYRCIRDDNLYNRLYSRLQCTLYAREEFFNARENWVATEDIVERAALWYTMTVESFIGKGTAFGRALNSKLTVNLDSKLKLLGPVHTRLRNVLIENRDWSDILAEFDSIDTVFYIDPPYLASSFSGLYKHELTYTQHKAMLDMIMNLKGYVALSGYATDLYDSYNWSERIEYDVQIGAASINQKMKTHGNNFNKEVLWIKK